MASIKFKRIDKENERKLKYEGFCSKCKKLRHHRLDSSESLGWGVNRSNYICMSCKTINSEDN